MKRPLVQAGLAVGTGLAVWASFPPLNWWPVAPIGVAGLTLLLRHTSRRRATLLGGLSGLGMWLPMLSFLRGFGVDAWLLLAVIESLWWVLAGLALRAVLRHRWWPLGTALVWVGIEFLRDRVPFQGFPWGRLAFGQAGGPLARLASVGGAPLVSLAVALLGGLLAYLLVDMSRRRLLAVTTAAAAIVAVTAGPLLLRLPTAGTSRDGAPSSAVVALIQGNVPRLGLEEFAQRRAVTAYHLEETEQLASEVAAGKLPKPQLVIWPENSSDLDPFHDPTAHVMLDEAAAAAGVPVLVGAVLDGPGEHHVRNAAVVWSPGSGPGEIYIKRHLVPFGEYLPWRGLLTRLVGRFSLLPNDFVAGHRPGLLHVGPVALADTICFEVADDTVVRQAVTAGGRLLAVQTNNADYERQGDSGNGGETAQQLAIARLRAIEHGRAVVVAATSGVSAVISPDGKVLARTGVYRPGILDMRVPLRDPLTLADRLGGWPERVMAALALAWVVCCLIPWRRRKSDTPPVDGPVREPAGVS